MNDEISFQQNGASGVITLNRPEALNALTLNMVRRMGPQLAAWIDDDTIENIVVEGAGEKGFCAGGDIRALHDWGRAGAAEATGFYREEYVLNRMIKTCPKPYIALMDGITMGGGVGVSVHGRYRVATQALVFAMPETGIGLLPDVGGTYFLPRLPGQIGAYLALTGARLRAADAVYAGIATHYTLAEKLPELKQALSQGGDVEAVLNAANAPLDPAKLANRQSDIDRLFQADHVVDILAALEADGSPWALEQGQTIEAKSPTSAAVALRQMRDGAIADFDACMKIEMRAVSRLMRLPDFYEGVRAIILEKDNQPKWSPAHHRDVSPSQVEAIFASLGADELTF
jgi:enoyl-CoA hydratase